MDKNQLHRQVIVIALFILVFFIYIVRLFTLQVLDSDYKLSAENNVFRHVIEYPTRGLIFDRKGELLVYNKSVFDISIIPKKIEKFDTLLLCRFLHIDKKSLKEKIRKAKRYSRYKPSIILQAVDFKEYSLLQENLYKFKGFYLNSRTLRAYQRPIAANILGYISEVDTSITNHDDYYKAGDYIGRSGIEKSYEEVLRGEKGVKIRMVDVHNRVKASYKNGKYDKDAKSGKNLISSIDAKLQEYGELLMKNKKGSIVAIEPASGEILTLLTSPSYDPELLVGRERTKNYRNLSRNKDKPLYNRALLGKYNPPGSTFKTVQALIGLQEGVITTNTSLPCNGGYSVGSFHQHCHHGGAVSFLRSIQGSCNAYYSQVFMKVLQDDKFDSISHAYQNWREHLLAFGIGRKLNIDLPYESRGTLYPKSYYDRSFKGKQWKPLRLVSMAIGQGKIGVTQLQLANMCATIANRGFYYIPHIIKSIGGEVKSLDKRFYEKQFTKIDQQYFEPVIDGMELVVTSGTARVAYLPNIAICGKTGTAENPQGKDHSIFIAFAPKYNPKIAIAVYVENAGFGSRYAAPIASLMIEKYLTDSISRPFLEEKMLNSQIIYEDL